MALLVVGLLALVYYSLKAKDSGLGKRTPVHLAVLPFTSTLEDPGTRAFCNGLTETLAVKLTQLSGSNPLQVVPTSEIRAEGITNVEQARKGFGVTLVLEGLAGVGQPSQSPIAWWTRSPCDNSLPTP